MIRKCGYEGKHCDNDEKVFDKLAICLNFLGQADELGLNNPEIKCGIECERKNKQVSTFQRMMLYNDIDYQ